MSPFPSILSSVSKYWVSGKLDKTSKYTAMKAANERRGMFVVCELFVPPSGNSQLMKLVKLLRTLPNCNQRHKGKGMECLCFVLLELTLSLEKLQKEEEEKEQKKMDEEKRRREQLRNEMMLLRDRSMYFSIILNIARSNLQIVRRGRTRAISLTTCRRCQPRRTRATTRRARAWTRARATRPAMTRRRRRKRTRASWASRTRLRLIIRYTLRQVRIVEFVLCLLFVCCCCCCCCCCCFSPLFVGSYT
jgi:hypothetical protein